MDPANGFVLALWPGESKKIAFTAPNPLQHQATFEAKVEGMEGFYSIDAGVHHVPQGGTARIEITFRAPEDALPEERLFQVRLIAGLREHNQQAAGYQGAPPAGSEDGQTVVRRWNLGLRVSVNPIVRLSLPEGQKLTSWSGPRSPFVTWNLRVESAKRTEMEWRIAAKNRDRVQEGDTDVIFGTQPWEYHFNQEMGRFERVGSRDPQAQDITLRARRRGRWWLGWIETHDLVVEAHPVTNPGNDNSADSRLHLRARRWRLWPCDGAFFAPLLVMGLLWFGPAPSSLVIKNALPYRDSEGKQALFVLERFDIDEAQELPGGSRSSQTGASTKVAQTIPIEMEWVNNWGAPLAIARQCASGSCGSENYSQRLFDFKKSTIDQPQVRAEDYYNFYNYSIGRWFGGSSDETRVNLVASRTYNRFSVRETDKSKIDLGNVETDGDTKHSVLKLSVSVPREGGKTLWFFNSSTPASNYEVRYWVAQEPSSYSTGDVIPQGVSVLKDGPRSLRITLRDKENNDQIDDKLVLVTTDAKAQIVEITLQTPPNVISAGGVQ